MNRRKLLISCSVLTISGCSSFSDTTNGSDSTTKVTQSTDAKALLPEVGEDWTRLSVEERAWPYLGGDGGLLAEYEAQNGDIHTVLIFEERDENWAESRAQEFICAGWPVATYRGRFALAAGTGTEQVTLTPEAPPHLDNTPLPDTERWSETLLLKSPYLTEAYLEEHRITTCD